jgi:hypothetical protein
VDPAGDDSGVGVIGDAVAYDSGVVVLHASGEEVEAFRRLITIPGVIPIKSKAVTSTSFLKVIDVPHIPAEPRVWLTTQRSAFVSALRSSPVGASLDKFIKHAPRFMRTSPHADTCVAWIDISDLVSGSNARNFIGKQVVIRSLTFNHYLPLLEVSVA